MINLIVSRFYKDKLLGFQLNDQRLTRIYQLDDNVVDNIYCGYIKDVVPNINACFVEFGNGQKGFLANNNLIVFNGYDRLPREGDKVLVQVIGDKIKTKDYSLSSKINLKSRDLILTVGNTAVSLSKKIDDEEKRKHIKELLSDYKTNEYGFIARTSITNNSDDEIKNQTKELITRWENIKNKFIYATPKQLIESSILFNEICKELSAKDDFSVITDENIIYEKSLELGINATFNNDDKISLENKYHLMKMINEVKDKKVWLKSGAYLIIESTEALTVIDVNSGKNNSKSKKDELIYKINLEASKEIINQLMLRNISGIVIVDFINMNDERNYIELSNYIKTLAKMDYCQCHIIGFTNLGLMEISRKKKDKPTIEILD